MNKIKLNKKFYKKTSLDNVTKDFKELLNIEEDNEYYIVSTDNKLALMELLNYLISIQ